MKANGFWLFFFLLFGGFSLAFFFGVHRSAQGAYETAKVAEPATIQLVETFWLPIHLLLLLLGWAIMCKVPRELRYMVALAVATATYFGLVVAYLIGVDVMHMPPLV